MASAHAWVLTINNPTYEDKCSIRALDSNKDICYIVCGDEGYQRGKTPHLQIAMCFHRKKTFKQMKEMFSRAHIEIVKFDFGLAAAYCKKEGIFREYGSLVQACILSSPLLATAKEKKDKIKEEIRTSQLGTAYFVPLESSEAPSKEEEGKGGRVTSVTNTSPDSDMSNSLLDLQQMAYDELLNKINKINMGNDYDDLVTEDLSKEEILRQVRLLNEASMDDMIIDLGYHFNVHLYEMYTALIIHCTKRLDEMIHTKLQEAMDADSFAFDFMEIHDK